MELSLLDAMQTADAIAKPVADAGHSIEPAAIDLLVSESARYPFFIQEYASAAWMQHAGKTIKAPEVDAELPGVRRFLAPLSPTRAGGHGHRASAARTVQEVAERLGATFERFSSIRNQLVRKTCCSFRAAA